MIVSWLLPWDVPAVKDEGKAVKYQVNKIFQQLNIEGEEPEEEDDDE